MKDAHAYLLEKVFRGFLERDPALLQSIADFDGDLTTDGDALLFTLPTLFAFICQDLAEHGGQPIDASRDSYLRFRQLLYKNPTNSRLKELGGQIVIHASSETHDRSVYKLVHLEGPGAAV